MKKCIFFRNESVRIQESWLTSSFVGFTIGMCFGIMVAIEQNRLTIIKNTSPPRDCFVAWWWMIEMLFISSFHTHRSRSQLEAHSIDHGRKTLSRNEESCFINNLTIVFITNKIVRLPRVWVWVWVGVGGCGCGWGAWRESDHTHTQSHPHPHPNWKVISFENCSEIESYAAATSIICIMLSAGKRIGLRYVCSRDWRYTVSIPYRTEMIRYWKNNK